MPGQKSSIVCDSSGNHGVLTIGGVAQAMPGQKSSIVCVSSGNHGVLTIGGGGTGNARPEIFYRVRLVWKPWSSHNRGVAQAMPGQKSTYVLSCCTQVTETEQNNKHRETVRDRSRQLCCLANTSFWDLSTSQAFRTWIIWKGLVVPYTAHLSSVYHLLNGVWLQNHRSIYCDVSLCSNLLCGHFQHQTNQAILKPQTLTWPPIKHDLVAEHITVLTSAARANTRVKFARDRDQMSVRWKPSSFVRPQSLPV
ncbi:hypothetical protein RRG08_062623 [Elysia crispata]|uniref:Uncharacterized protein n=1 Tax=Elysia crispata TaxID=231223 RepID=A0AAE0YZR1_9GAST|nr:hypothetical protein RRG08_062623 [Elysia crispata]